MSETPQHKITLTLLPGGVLKCDWFPCYDNRVREEDKPFFVAMLQEAQRVLAQPKDGLASHSPVGVIRA